jgi:2-polyprenyl-3-methyl-5-hydroxy-6-metoxy-1,4-benzoquinol methylase
LVKSEQYHEQQTALYREYASTFRRASRSEGAVIQEENVSLKRLVKRYFPSDHSVTIVDLGCGNGNFLSLLSRTGYRNIRGIDISPEQVRLARERGLSSVEQNDLGTALPAMASSSIDIVIAFDVLEHINPEATLSILKQMRRILKPNGLLALHVPNALSPFFGRIRYGDITHFSAFTPQSVSQLLFTAGFSDVACVEDTPVAHGIKSGLRALLWRVVRLPLVFYIAVETGAWDHSQLFSQNMLVLAHAPKDETL